MQPQGGGHGRGHWISRTLSIHIDIAKLKSQGNKKHYFAGGDVPYSTVCAELLLLSLSKNAPYKRRCEKVDDLMVMSHHWWPMPTLR